MLDGYTGASDSSSPLNQLTNAIGSAFCLTEPLEASWIQVVPFRGHDLDRVEENYSGGGAEMATATGTFSLEEK